MKLDTRNPFADWGFEEEVYAVNIEPGDDSGIVKLEEKGFVNETVVDEDYNQVAQPISGESFSQQHTEQASFFTNNENMLPTSLATKAYGDNQSLQREYPAGESLNYYGNEADDLKLYGDPTIPADYEVVTDPENIPTEDTQEIKVATVGNETANALTNDTYYKELMVTEANINSDVKYFATDKLTIENVSVSGEKGTSNGKVNYAAPVVEISNVTVGQEIQTTTYNMFEGASSTNENYNGLHRLDVTGVNIDNPGLQHNVINVYTPADNAVITIRNSNFDLNVNNTNVLRLANYLNADNVTVNFENVNWTYENGSPQNASWGYAGLVIYQPANQDTALTGDYSHISTWKFNFKNCKYNGEKINSNNFGEHSQTMYCYDLNNVHSPLEPSTCGMTLNFN